mgnify:CR=1 FL=1
MCQVLLESQYGSLAHFYSALCMVLIFVTRDTVRWLYRYQNLDYFFIEAMTNKASVTVQTETLFTLTLPANFLQE